MSHFILTVIYIAKGLKSLARELNLPVLALYQVGQDVGRRSPQDPEGPGESPIPSSLAGYADQVLLLQRDDLDFSEEQWKEHFARLYPGKLVVRVSLVRNRRGPTGSVYLRIRGELARFESLPRSEEL